MKHTTSALVFAAAALLAAPAQAAPPLMDVAQGAATEAGTPLTLTARAPLTLTVKTLHWSEKIQDFLEDVKLTRKLAAGESYSFTFLPAGDIPNLALCAAPEAGAQQCWKPAFSGEDGRLLMEPGFALKGAAPGRLYLNPDKPHYTNARYGFALTLPPGQWEVRESDNGDGITAKDGESDPKSREIRAWGTNSPGVLGQSLKDVLADAERDFASVTRREVDEAAARFTLAGTAKAGGQLYVRGFVSKEVANIVRVATPDGWQAGFDVAVRAVEASFKPGF